LAVSLSLTIRIKFNFTGVSHHQSRLRYPLVTWCGRPTAQFLRSQSSLCRGGVKVRRNSINKKGEIIAKSTSKSFFSGHNGCHGMLCFYKAFKTRGWGSTFFSCFRD
jgi:hypothetical protein